MRTFQLKLSRESILGLRPGGKVATYDKTTILNYRYTKEDGVQILDSLGGWRKSMLRIDALLNMAGIQETTNEQIS